ncbi:MAG: hypothetical protein Q7O66_14015 [Dehalococcoidia bacterium]|nr:hypothetical protein [Dehalococcoidia bacterium]
MKRLALTAFLAAFALVGFTAPAHAGTASAVNDHHRAKKATEDENPLAGPNPVSFAINYGLDRIKATPAIDCHALRASKMVPILLNVHVPTVYGLAVIKREGQKNMPQIPWVAMNGDDGKAVIIFGGDKEVADLIQGEFLGLGKTQVGVSEGTRDIFAFETETTDDCGEDTNMECLSTVADMVLNALPSVQMVEPCWTPLEKRKDP